MARIRLTGDATLAADRFVFACGPWLPAMFPDVLGSHVAVTRQEVYFFGPPKDAGTSWSGAMPVFADVGERFWYGLPDIERRGVKICDDTHGPAFDPTDGARVATSEGIAAARAFLAERLPRLADAPLLESRVCQYTVTPHEDFFIDRHPGFDNVWLAGGGSGHAFKHGPILGEIAADRALGVPNRPGQFTSPT